MKIDDSGIITFVKKYEENSLLVKVLSKENGLVSGYITHAKKEKNNCQLGNLIKFIWSAKNINQLGNLKIELIKSHISYFIENLFFLNLLESMTLLINTILYERFLEKNLFVLVNNIIVSVHNKETTFEILKKYLIFENTLLNVVGTGIIFDEEEIIENLFYISPKTGLAVSKTKGGPYKDKLLFFPKIFKKNKIEKEDIFECFNVIDFFLKKYLNEISEQKYQNIIVLRTNLLKII
jgi:DNA repair protein RecO (recombination protein O)